MTTVKFLAFLGVVFIGCVHGQETGLPPSAMRQVQTYEFLNKYGYFDNLPDKSPGERPNQSEVREALRSMQRIAGIPETGEIDDKTVEMLTKPRCGVKDGNPRVMVEKSVTGRRGRRFSVLGDPYKWSKNDLTYKIVNYPSDNSPDLTMEQVNEDIVAAFKVWSDVTPLTFTEKHTDDADIKIKFGARLHTSVKGDPTFDGPGGTLAHAFTPNSGWGETNGDVHLDDDETFTKAVYTGTNLFYTLTHEIGHAIGMFHSDVSDSLMWPYDRGYIPNFKLPQDDILGIQSLYGPNTGHSVTEQPMIATRPHCNTTFDATAVINDQYYMFGNNLLWRFDVNRNLLSPPEGQSPRDIFPKFPKSGVKAVYEKSGSVIVLKGKNYWIYEVAKSSTPNSPRFQQKDVNPEKNTDFPQNVRVLGFPKFVTGVVHLENIGFSYLIKGRAVYTFDENRLELSPSSVKVSSVFEGVTGRPTSAFYDKGFANVLIGQEYHRYVFDYDTSSFVAVRGYPRNFAEEILFCPPADRP